MENQWCVEGSGYASVGCTLEQDADPACFNVIR